MKKKISLLTLALIVLLMQISVGVNTSSAKEDNILPEKEGDYSVPGRPDLRLRVFIYHGKDAVKNLAKQAGKPAPQPSLVCSNTQSTDPDSLSQVKPTGWTLPSTWTYRVNTSSVPSTIGAASLVTIINNGYRAWADAISNKVLFTRGSDTITSRAQFDGQNIISWGRTSGTALAVTYTWYNPTTGKASEIDTLFNKSFTWHWSDPSTWPLGQTCAYQGVYDAQNILTHELGHTMGLGDEYTGEFIHNTMYGYGSTGEAKKDTLTTGDVSSVSVLY